MNRFWLLLLIWAASFAAFGAGTEETGFKFPPPEFETAYKMPSPTTPGPRELPWHFIDVGVLALALATASYLVLQQRSRKWLIGLSLFSLAYFGFYRKGCVCAIGSIQNVTLGFFDSSYGVPLSVAAFFFLPLVTALFAGRTFCAGVCPHGALQDLVLIKPVRVPVWLESALGVLPYIFLGAGVLFAATGSAFVICQYDPFIPIFRMTGSMPLLLTGVGLLALGMFVGRPYCRFLCPYGALLRLAGLASKWRVTITPDDCKKCRVCEDACPYEAIREPLVLPAAPAPVPSPAANRTALYATLALVPVLMFCGGLIGSKLAVPASRVHPDVSLAERHAAHLQSPVQAPPQTAPVLSMARADLNPQEVRQKALKAREKFVLGGWLFGAWVGLVIGVRMSRLALPGLRPDYEPDAGACVACARCFVTCPREQLRLKRAATPAAPATKPAGPSTTPANA